jgi:hypothetical protein
MAVARAEGILTPLIYYIGYVDEEMGVPPELSVLPIVQTKCYT